MGAIRDLFDNFIFKTNSPKKEKRKKETRKFLKTISKIVANYF